VTAKADEPGEGVLMGQIRIKRPAADPRNLPHEGVEEEVAGEIVQKAMADP